MTMSGGSVMFEAMACAKPVLYVRTDSRHSVHMRHGETAWCVTTDRPEPATAALAQLAGDPDLRQRLGLAARAWAQRHLSVATMVTRTQALYDRLLRR
jgi:glycosyltransferase involved in cell wall biosynthesis